MKFSRFSSNGLAVVIIGLGLAVGPGQALAQSRPLGIDVSSFQGSADNPPTTINWTNVKSAGIAFAWAKATQGTYYTDADFAGNEAHAKAAGVYIGAYDFADYNSLPGTNGADTEAAYFWNVAGNYIVAGGYYMMPMLDVELALTNNTGATVSAWVNEWCQDIVNYAKAKGVTVKPVVYTYTSFASDYLNSSVTQWPLWMASPNGQSPQTGSPSSTGLWSTWTFWQYGGGTVSGVEGSVDEDVFNGTSATLLTYVIGAQVAPANATLYWDPGGKKASPGSGGLGNWDLTTQDWWLSGTSNLSWSTGGDNPIFAGTAGTAALSASVSAGGLTFNTAGYTISGSANTLTLTNSPSVISVPPPGTSPVTLSCILAGSSYTVTGGGVLVLNNTANSVVSPINVVSNTTLVITASRAIGIGSGTVTLSGGSTLQNNDATSGDTFLNSAFGIVLGTGGGNLNDNINANLTYAGIISGSGSLTKIGGGGGTGGTLILNGTNTYTGSTTISQGVLALGGTGSINASPTLTINAGGSLDVSAIANWTLNSSAVLKAGGTGATVGSTAATLKGAAANGASLGTSPITLFFTPTATNGDASHPALYVSQGTLTLGHGNTFTISNASSAQLGVGLYTLIQQAGGSISGAPNPAAFFASGGAGVASGTKSSLSVSGASVLLTIAHSTTTTLGALTPSTYGQSVTFTATVAPAPSGGTVQFYTNGAALGAPAAVSGGAASYTTSAFAVGSYPVTAIYSGVTFYTASTNAGSLTQQVTPAALAITASPQNKTYGQTVVFGAGSQQFTSNGLQNGETIGSVTLAVNNNGGAGTAPVAGSPYAITPGAAAGGTFLPGNYNITYNPGALTVNPAPLTVAADNFSQPYGAANPLFTVTYSNFVNGETLGTSDVAGSPVLSTGANSNSPVGQYDITNSLGTLTSTNYAFNLVDGTLTVTNAVSSNVVASSENPALPGDFVTFTATLGTLTPSLAVPCGPVQFQIDGVPSGSAVTLSNGVAVSAATASLAHGYHAIEADYAGGTNIIGSTNTLMELINTPPVAGPAAYSRARNAVLDIAVSDLLTNAGDADGDALSLAAVSATSTNGAALSTNATDVFYTPPASNGNVTDSFSYTVADIYGATSTNLVVVTVQPTNTGPSVTITGITLLANGTVQLNFTGAAGGNYLIEAATNLTAPITWTTLSTNGADTNGMFSFTDLCATNYNGRYYRAAAQ